MENKKNSGLWQDVPENMMEKGEYPFYLAEDISLKQTQAASGFLPLVVMMISLSLGVGGLIFFVSAIFVFQYHALYLFLAIGIIVLSLGLFKASDIIEERQLGNHSASFF